MKGLGPIIFLSTMICVACSTSQGKTRYMPVEIPLLAGGEYLSMNNNLQMAGYLMQDAWGPVHACLYDYTKASLIDLGTLVGGWSNAYAINDPGQVVGQSDDHAFVWEGGIMIDLGVINPDGGMGASYGINNRGQAVGESTVASGATRASFWNPGENPVDLGSLYGYYGYSCAYAINDGGTIAGWTWVDTPIGPEEHACLWNSMGIITDLGTFGGSYAHAYDLNERNQVVGVIEPYSSYTAQAFVWDNGVCTPLGTLGGPGSEAKAINELGQIVGWTRRTDYDLGCAFLYENGIMIDLNTLIDPSLGVELGCAFDIDDYGNIICSGQVNGRGAAFLLLDNRAAPTPAPDAVMLVALGTILVGRLRVRMIR